MAIMRPSSNRLQEQTGWRMLSAEVPFEKRFDPEGPYQEAFRAGGWNTYIDQLKEEDKKKKQQQAAFPSFIQHLIAGMARPFSGIRKDKEEAW